MPLYIIFQNGLLTRIPQPQGCFIVITVRQGLDIPKQAPYEPTLGTEINHRGWAFLHKLGWSGVIPLVHRQGCAPGQEHQARQGHQEGQEEGCSVQLVHWGAFR